MKRAIVTSLLVAGMVCGSIELAYADKGGNPNHQGGKTRSTASATLTSSCDPTCYPDETIYFTGEGFDGSQGYAMVQLGVGVWSAVGVAADGTVAFQFSQFGVPGDYAVQLYQDGKGNKLEMKAEVIVTIQ